MISSRSLALTVSLVVCSAADGFSASSRYTNEFLQAGLGARAMGWGGAPFVAVADDASATYWNPAGLVQVDRPRVESLFRRRLGNVFQDYELDYAVPRSRSAAGFSYFQVNSDEIPVTRTLTPLEENLFRLGQLNLEEPETRRSRESALLLSYARRIDQRLSLGTTLKLVNHDLLGLVQGYGGSLDLGILFLRGRWAAGLTVQDMVQYMAFHGRQADSGESFRYREKSPVGFRAGLAYRVPITEGENQLTVSLAGEGYGMEMDPRLGVELHYKVIQARGGVLFNRRGRRPQISFQSTHAVQPSFGLGFDLERLGFQYGVQFHPLGLLHTVGLSYKWGKTPPGREPLPSALKPAPQRADEAGQPEGGHRAAH